MDNQQKTLRELALFAGAGGGILGGKLLGWETVCAVENEPYPASVLVARQNEGFLPPFPIWDDVRTFDGRPWKGIVDVVSGGFPCQDISQAGRGGGLEGSRSGLWFEMLRIVTEVEPRFVFIENSPLLRTRGLNVVLQGLAENGYDVAWGVLSASDCGANHQRKRMWVLAHSAKPRLQGTTGSTSTTIGRIPKKSASGSENVAHSESKRTQQLQAEPKRRQDAGGRSFDFSWVEGEGKEKGWGWWEVEPNVDRVVDGMAARVDRLKAIGNGQVPIVAAVAFSQLYTSLMENT